MPSLYTRLGGRPAVAATVASFFSKVLEDEDLRPFFEGADLDRQRAQQRAFLTFVFGGPREESDRDPRSTHDPLVEKGLREEHFQALATHLATSLAELDASAELIAEVVAIVASTHNDSLGT